MALIVAGTVFALSLPEPPKIISGFFSRKSHRSSADDRFGREAELPAEMAAKLAAAKSEAEKSRQPLPADRHTHAYFSLKEAAGAYSLDDGWGVVVTPLRDNIPSLKVTHRGVTAMVTPYGGPECCPGGRNYRFLSHNGDFTDILIATDGDDTILSPPDAIRCLILGLAGNDTITGSRGNDVIIPGSGRDIVLSSGGDDRVFRDDEDGRMLGPVGLLASDSAGKEGE